MKRFTWRIILIVLVLTASLVVLLASLPGVAQSPLAPLLPDTRIRLGLDLRGGTHLTLGVDVDNHVAGKLMQTAEELYRQAQKNGLPVEKPRLEAGTVVLHLSDAMRQASFDALLQHRFAHVQFTSDRDDTGGIVYRGRFRADYADSLKDMAVEQIVRTLRDRIDQFGVSEPDIRKQSGYQIQLQLPGLSDPDRAIQLIGQTAQLTFHLVRDDLKPDEPLPEGVLPYPQVINKSSGVVASSEMVLLDSTPLMTGENIMDARPAFDGHNRPCVALHFNHHGAADLERVTGQHLNKRLAIVLDGKIYTIPTIRERIVGGDASITGSFSTTEAQDLAIVLRSGALPAPVVILEERNVGPTLGQESIEQGLLASLVGTAAVALIMVLYYGMAGLVADVMLVFTIILLLAGLALFGATLTLPGIAGIVLTIGMSVDANVLIFERMREELKKGLTPPEVIKAGFERASTSILDANITTLLAAAVLYQFGTGPVRGFAVTLSIGILASMFTAIFVSRVIFTLRVQCNAGKPFRV